MTPIPEVQERLRRYLLGQLTDDAREEVEKDLLASDEVFEELLVVEDELVDQYLHESLETTDRTAFESHFLTTPDRQEKLKFGRAFNRYLSSQAAAAPARKTKTASSSWAFPKTIFSSPLRIGVLAVVVMGIAFGAWRIFFHQSEVDKGLLALNAAYRQQRPLESRISSFDYAPYLATRGPGDEKVDQNELTRAELWLQEALKKNPTPAAYHALGKVYLAKRDYQRAINNFEEALKSAPPNAQLYSDLGAAVIEQGEQDKSGPEPGKGLEELARGRENLTNALKLNPRLLEALFNRALCSEYQQLHEQAREEWQQYLAADSTSRWAIEARERLRKLEEQKARTSRTSEQLPRDFFEAYQSGNEQGAWAALSHSRTRFGNTIVEALVDEYLQLAINGQSAEANATLENISFAGKVEQARIGDRYTSDLVQFYQAARTDQLSRLVQARALMKDARKLYEGKGEFEPASLIYLQARDAFASAGDEYEALIADSLVGYCGLRIPQPQKSIEIFERFSRECEARGYRSLFAQSLSALADAQSSLGEFSKTLEYAGRGLQASKEIQDTILAIRCLGQNISIQLALGNYRASLESLDEAIDLADTLGPNPTLTWQLYIQAALDFHFLGFSSSALAFQQEALRLAIATGLPLLRSRTWEQMGVLYGEYKNYDEAIKSGEKAVAEGQNISEKSRNNVVARSTLTLGKLHLAAGHQRLAIQKFDESISIYEKLHFYIYLYEAHKGKLRALIDLHEDAAAAAELTTVLGLFEQNWSKISEESNRDNFFDTGQDTYDIAADFAYSRLKDEKRAYEYAEASRARSLLEMMTRGARVKEGRSVPEIDLASHTDSLRLDQIQAGLPERAQLIEYSLLPDKLIIWVINKREIKSQLVALDQTEFDRQIQDYRKLIANGANAETRTIVARELYTRLISPIEPYLDPNLQVFIAADKGLHFLPFATLISPVSGKFLIENYSIEMVPSASVLILSSEQAKKKAGARDETVLSVGKPNFDQSAFPGLPGLPGADREARAIGASYRYRTVLVGPEALAGQVVSELKNADVIHLATHAVADARSPLLTKLLLAGSRTDGVNSHHASNGFLQASQIYELKLPRARLVVLSACQTGIERAYRGEGAIGLARPFLVAGVPVVVASLWPVDSEATAELMIRFHEYRTRDHEATVEALRHAQLDMIRNPPPGSQGTFGWAAFVAIGGYAEF